MCTLTPQSFLGSSQLGKEPLPQTGGIIPFHRLPAPEFLGVEHVPSTLNLLELDPSANGYVLPLETWESSTDHALTEKERRPIDLSLGNAPGDRFRRLLTVQSGTAHHMQHLRLRKTVTQFSQWKFPSVPYHKLWPDLLRRSSGDW